MRTVVITHVPVDFESAGERTFRNGDGPCNTILNHNRLSAERFRTGFTFKMR